MGNPGKKIITLNRRDDASRGDGKEKVRSKKGGYARRIERYSRKHFIIPFPKLAGGDREDDSFSMSGKRPGRQGRGNGYRRATAGPGGDSAAPDCKRLQATVPEDTERGLAAILFSIGGPRI